MVPTSSLYETLVCKHSNVRQSFHGTFMWYCQFTTLCKVVQTFLLYIYETLMCKHWNDGYWAALLYFMLFPFQLCESDEFGFENNWLYNDHNWLQVLSRSRTLPKNEPSGFCALHTDKIFLKMYTYPWRYLRLIFPYKIGLIRAFTSEKKPIIMTSEWLICPVTILYRLINWNKEIEMSSVSEGEWAGRDKAS